jgi:putative Mg2+ transporter-C (MgtC) family protein
MHINTHLAINFAAAWLGGALIGIERSYHGRAAGFRTHCLVAIASAAAVMVAYVPVLNGLFPGSPLAEDPGRMAQGVMTGVGFLGAGVIYKEGVNVQGLTTAASVWATAAIGLLCGVGAHVPAALATGAVLATLVVLRWAELKMPSKVYVWSVFRFKSEVAPTSAGLKALLAEHGASMSEPSYARRQGGAILEYAGSIECNSAKELHELAERLRAMNGLAEYELQRISK